MSIYFVSGIDTGIGKTIATGAMACYLLHCGIRVISAKMVQTGNDGFSEDLLKHREMTGTGLFPEDREGLTAPQIFRYPASPHLAAKLEHRTLDLDAIRIAVELLSERYEIVLVEGAGGLAVPLTEDLLTVDFVAERKWPLILVSSARLGSLNHTIQAIEMAASRNLQIVGTVFNCCPENDEIIRKDSRRMIEKYLLRHGHRPAIVDLPEIGDPVPRIDFSVFFNNEKTRKDTKRHEKILGKLNDE